MPADLTRFAHRRIALAQVRIDRAKERKAEIIAELQETCKHEHVAEQPYQGGDSGYRPPRRICLVCGREESASLWPSSYAKLHRPKPGGGMEEIDIRKTQLNNELVHKVPDVYRYRP